MSEWYVTLSHWLEANPEWLGLAIFLAACLECLAVAGILIPGTVLLFALGVMAGSGALSLGETLLLAYTGTLNYGEAFAKGGELAKLAFPGTDWMLITVICI